jgi:deazaflavin-dependent oxidoreductase (nitroreductase family)
VALEARLADLSVCDLETVGRRSGERRVVEMWFAADPDSNRIFMLSGGGDRAHWVRNLRRQPAVRVRIGGVWFAGRAVEAHGPDDVLARELLAGKYQGWHSGAPLSGWARTAMAVAVDLEPTEAAA